MGLTGGQGHLATNEEFVDPLDEGLALDDDVWNHVMSVRSCSYGLPMRYGWGGCDIPWLGNQALLLGIPFIRAARVVHCRYCCEQYDASPAGLQPPCTQSALALSSPWPPTALHPVSSGPIQP